MASLAKRLAARMGYELKKKYGTLPSLDFLETLLLGALAAEGRLNVVQVGANDGSHSDPIHRFLMDHKQSSTVLLIEPQPEIIRHLEDAYADHPTASIYNGAIGTGERLVLHRIRPELWESFRVSYLKGAPAYRAPSGLTSGNRAHVVAAARRHLAGKVQAEEAVEELHVPCTELRPLLIGRSFPLALHLLQVDAEGVDDEVLYACNIDQLRPAIINFESKHLVGPRMAKLQAFLSGLGYTLFQWNKTDTVALRVGLAAGSAR
jgi:FkbM family methyltransferase